MKLSLNSIIEILKNPSSKEEIKKGRRQQSRLRLFTESQSEKDLIKEFGYIELLSFMKKTLSENKYNRVKDFIQYPLPVVDITESIKSDIYKVFNGGNQFFDYTLPNKEQESKFRELVDQKRIQEFVIRVAKGCFLNEPNNIIVIDRDENGIPYPLIIGEDRIYDLKTKQNGKGQLEYIAFIHSVEKDKRLISFYDEEYYRVFIENENGSFSLYNQMEYKHNASECPAKMFMPYAENNHATYRRKNPLTNSLSKLEEWQLFNTYKFYADHYSSFPVIERPEEDCSQDTCDNGVITIEEYHNVEGNETISTRKLSCPECNSKNVIGPGTEIEIPSRIDKDDVDSSGIFKFISPDVTSLKELAEKLDKLESHIHQKVVGTNQMTNNQALNEKQVQGSFESMHNVLIDNKNILDDNYKWILKKFADLFFESDVDIKINADFGNEFYLVSEEEWQKRIKSAVESNLPKIEIDELFKQFINTKYRNNPHKLNRINIISLIDPFPYLSNKEVVELFKMNIIDNVNLLMKINLIKFVNRFEVEQGDLVSFGSKLSLDVKVNRIQEIFNKYTNEQISKSEPNPISGEGVRT